MPGLAHGSHSWAGTLQSIQWGKFCVSGREEVQLEQEAQKNAKRSGQAGGQRWVTWNSLSLAAMLFTGSCKPNCWGSVLVKLEVSLWGWSYKLEQGHSLQGGCILVWGHPTRWVNTGVVASCGCSVLPLCVCLWFPIPPWEETRNSWSQLVLKWSFASAEMQVAGFAVLTEGKSWVREEFLRCTSWLLET